MIIQHNIMAINSNNRLGTNNGLVAKNLEKLSSGYKINRAGDDAAGLAVSEKMRAQITGLDRAKQNSQDAISLVQTAEGNLTEVHSMLNRMVDLATQASNGTIDDTVDRANLQLEVDALLEEIDRIAVNADFNGIKLLDGSVTAMRLQIGDTDAQFVELAITNQDATTLGVAALDVSTSSAAVASIALVKTAINTVSTSRAGLGAIQNRLEHTVSNLTTTAENMTAAESRIRDTDMAKEMMSFTKNNVLAQAAQAMLAQANQQPQQVLQLLR